MTTSVVEIVNLALARLGESPIQSLDEGTVPSNMAKLFYDPARKAVLRDFVWNFSLSVTALARLELTPGDFRYGYAMPHDCLRVVRLRGGTGTDFDEGGPRFTVRGGVLFTDADRARLEYVRDVTDPTEFDDKFVEALAYRLASDLAMPVKGSAELMANYMNVYSVKIGQAATLSAKEEADRLPENPYEDARLGAW